MDIYDENSITESIRAPDWLILHVQAHIKALGTAVLVNLEKQKEGWQEGILVPDAVIAKRDRRGLGDLRLGTVACSSNPEVQPGSVWYIDPDAGQWWNSKEANLYLGLDIPDNWQLRLYLKEDDALVCQSN